MCSSINIGSQSPSLASLGDGGLLLLLFMLCMDSLCYVSLL